MNRRILAVSAAGLMVLGACGSSKTADAPAATPAPAATEAPAPAATEAEAPAATEAEAPAATEAEAPAATEAEAPAADGAATAGEGCGLNNGEKASGDPIVLGNVTTSIPGIDFSVGPAMMDAYFRCVNENGGINGRPIAMKMENDNGTPDDAAAAARKLIETDKVVGMVGGFSILDCPVNAAYYEEKGYNVIVAGVPGECFGSPNIAAANMGPGYSSLGASQVMVDKGAKGKIVTMTGKAPNSEYNNSLAAKHIVASGLETEDIQLDLPINDPTAAILDAVERAGEGGGVLLTFTPPEGLKLLKAAEEQGLIDKVIWGSATPLNDTFVAQQLGAPWKGKLNINAEFSLLDDPRPEVELARQVQAEYNTDAKSFGSFEQMGFVMGRIIVHTLLQMDPADLDDSVAVNAAIKAIANFKSDHLCKPWYFGGLPDGNVPNNTDYNVVPNGTDKMELDQDCFAIAEVEPVLTAVRAAEAAGGLNDG